MDLKQSLKLTQQLLMTPQLQQAIKLLQLSRVELEDFVQNQLAENPVLEEGPLESPEEKAQMEKERERTEEQVVGESMESANIVDKLDSHEQPEMDWENLSRFQEQATPIPTSLARKDDEFPNYENIVTRSRTLSEHLMTQIGELEFNPQEQKIAEIIIGNLDERGYLRTSVEEIGNAEHFDQSAVEDILDSVQRLDPPGVAARDLRECLLLQLRTHKLKNGIVEHIVDKHLSELETRNYQVIARSLKISLDQVIENIHIIAELEPNPGRQFSGEATQYIVPDVYVFKVAGEWVVGMNEEGLPKLRLSKVYRDMLATNQARGQDKEYIQEKLKSAVWLIKSIQQRQKTIYRVTECIVKRQRDFFDYGVEHLRPMILKDIAEDISMHESTISRVTNNKYVHTPRGIFELKYFFNSSVSRTGGADLASESVKKMISDLIKTEDLKKPFSDQRVVEVLEEKGIQLARRTVAKYREQLRILPSSKRKKYF